MFGLLFRCDNLLLFFLQDLEVKSLLLEAYVKGQQELLYVVPFVAKVLESSLRSMVSELDQSALLCLCVVITSPDVCRFVGLQAPESLDHGHYECSCRAASGT